MSAESSSRLPRAHWVVWLLAAVGLIGIVATLSLAAFLLAGEPRYQPAKVAGAKEEITFTVDSARELPGTNLIQLDVNASQGLGGSSAYSRGGDDRRNILLIDRTSGASRRILPDNERHIDTARFLPAGAEAANRGANGAGLDGTAAAGGEEPPAAYYLLAVDQRGQPERKDVLVGTLADARQGWVMRGIDGIDTVWMHSPTQIGLLVRERLGLYYRIVDIPALKVVQSRRIEIG
jgi:hypothetical protein